jgi:transcriptional regulator NrdR family protein
MGTEENVRTRRDCIEIVDEDCAAAFESFYDYAVVNRIVVTEHRRTEFFERQMKAFDGHLDARTKSTRIGQEDAESLLRRHVLNHTGHATPADAPR